ncbi:ABC transporter ATP-binding protein [Schaalia sp. 19OD2882]|uniref:ABC transporter ATP-binding protein n=1 Tax=Schaalia sp. 19OD2882 TaxID=2794089 RepID=UPI001C1F031A|nr:ABC transporter ATP-binding protein [Schaalia sp. 19OD2882]QWW19597.1 ABC transporter ATP-binding protein [Schaalia sp. 19OD2882]
METAPQNPPRDGIVATALTKTYQRGGQSVHALDGVHLHVPKGAQVAVMGPSGSGKTTLLHCLSGILTPTSGSVTVDGKPLTGLSDAATSRMRLESFGFVFQDGQLLPELPAEENVTLPLMLLGTPRAKALEVARQLLARLGLSGLGPHRPGQLSGGQAQRVAIARALVTNPSVVFADEPTGALDQTTGGEVMDVLTQACAATGASLVLVTHDANVASRLAHTIHVRDGRILQVTRSAR